MFPLLCMIKKLSYGLGHILQIRKDVLHLTFNMTQTLYPKTQHQLRTDIRFLRWSENLYFYAISKYTM